MSVLLAISIVLLLAVVGLLAGLSIRLETRLRALEGRLLDGPDLSGLNTRVEELFVKLRALPAMEQRLVFIDGTMRALPHALKAIGDKIDRMFQEFEEKTLPEDSKGIGAQSLSRIARARAEMERQETASFEEFNKKVEDGGRGGRPTPIVVAEGL